MIKKANSYFMLLFDIPEVDLIDELNQINSPEENF